MFIPNISIDIKIEFIILFFIVLGFLGNVTVSAQIIDRYI